MMENKNLVAEVEAMVDACEEIFEMTKIRLQDELDEDEFEQIESIMNLWENAVGVAKMEAEVIESINTKLDDVLRMQKSALRREQVIMGALYRLDQKIDK